MAHLKSYNMRAVFLVSILLIWGEPMAAPSALPIGVIQDNVEQRVVNLQGHLEAFERVEQSARVSGYLETIRVDLGDQVQKGEVIAELSVPELQAQTNKAQARFAEAKAKLEQAERAVHFKTRLANRLDRLARQHRGTVTAEEVDQADSKQAAAEAKLQVRKAAVRVAKAELENLRARLSFSRVRAPFDGIVVQRLVHTGALLSNKTPIVELIRSDKLRLVIDAPQRIAPYLRIGDPVRVRFNALPGKVFRTSVSRIASVLSADGSLRAEADLALAPGLLPGMQATVAIQMW